MVLVIIEGNTWMENWLGKEVNVVRTRIAGDNRNPGRDVQLAIRNTNWGLRLS